MKTTMFFLMLASAVLTGCGDSSSKPAQSTNATSDAVLTAPAEYVGAMGRAQQSAVKTVDTSSLRQAIQMFQADQGTLPKDLNELVQKKFLPRLPEPPAGMRFDYNPGTGEIRVIRQ